MKKKAPIKLKTVKAQKADLCHQILSDVERANEFYHIFPEFVADGLMKDLEYLLFRDIAEEFRLILYNPLDSDEVFVERSYRQVSGRPLWRESVEEFRHVEIPTPYECDIFVTFTGEFLSREPAARRQLLEQCHFEWRDTSQFDPSAPVIPEVERDETEAHDGQVEMEEPEAVATPTAAPVPAPSPVLETPPGDDGKDKNLFTSEKALFIAAYSDSRKLIDRFVRMSKQRGLSAIQWTYSEGFEAIADSGEKRYLHNDDYFSRSKLSPFETLRLIKNEARRNTVYLLEDFHYYLTRENLAGGDYGELISMIKSLPESLKPAGNIVVILAPSIDLPPEIAPIFEVIKNDAGEKGFHYLKIYGTDLTKLVLEKKLKPVIGRDNEIMECLKVLSRLEGNNPLLVGKSGVGKTAIVEGLAAAIIKNGVPRMFANKRIISLNLNSMVSGTKYRGEFEKRLEGVLDEVRSNAERVIIFIDEIHSLLGMGSSEGATGAENILKPSLARGEFPCIGATTVDEYSRYIAPDRALARRFQVVNVPETDVTETIRILKGVKSVYEHHHQVEISDEALVKCVEMSGQMMVNECFPGKALRMLDTVCSAASLAGKGTVTSAFLIGEVKRTNATV